MDNFEKDHQETVVELIAPHGLGFGEGGISVKEQIEQGIITEEAPGVVHEVLTDDPEAFKQVEAGDDGCGDGRPWSKIVQIIIENGERKVHLYKTSLLRAKVFGGGLVTAASMWRTTEGASHGNQSVSQDREFMAGELAKRNFAHGAHSDDHCQGGKCGCGAIDSYPLITANAVKYRKEIAGTLEVIYGKDFENNKEAIEEAFEVYEALAKDAGYFDATGEQTMNQLLEAGAVVKELTGNHVEETIVINDAPKTTLDQRYFTETVKNRCVGKKPKTIQAFCVDTWRGREIADVVAQITKEQDPEADIENVRKVAYADFLIRTLAVAGTLTAGDLPVYRRRLREEEELEVGLAA